jgi:hypothetical protein
MAQSVLNTDLHKYLFNVCLSPLNPEFPGRQETGSIRFTAASLVASTVAGLYRNLVIMC